MMPAILLLELLWAALFAVALKFGLPFHLVSDPDHAVAAAYGWSDYTWEMPDEEILRRLLALNLARAAQQAPATEHAAPENG